MKFMSFAQFEMKDGQSQKQSVCVCVFAVTIHENHSIGNFIISLYFILGENGVEDSRNESRKYVA